ncbi:hypothetical protein M378DRAFT_762796 [Amanita muscaria Koide BX008]|uniref:Uncharacterized protein n=1 Tax=Amanita muscaria (strain Koide BX008) TaxID=946122 RepID=A0A0C2XHW9_AMAMK|nr:hypothetical protein M378DRAFT_762796 [Amanita muscaria Koide BX008]
MTTMILRPSADSSVLCGELVNINCGEGGKSYAISFPEAILITGDSTLSWMFRSLRYHQENLHAVCSQMKSISVKFLLSQSIEGKRSPSSKRSSNREHHYTAMFLTGTLKSGASQLLWITPLNQDSRKGSKDYWIMNHYQSVSLSKTIFRLDTWK